MRPDRVLTALQFALQCVVDEAEQHTSPSTGSQSAIKVLHELISLRNAGRLVVKNESQGMTDDDGKHVVVRL
jgi:hypothetical protein